MTPAYRDPLLTPEERVADLLPRLSLEEKVGLLFQTVLVVGDPGEVDGPDPMGIGTVRELVERKHLSHFNVLAIPSARGFARWQNALQEFAATATPNGMPITLASDPRHGFAENLGMGFAAGAFSAWPEALGFGALRDPARVRGFADVVRREYRALGLTAALHPQIDLATEPRWARQLHTFGQDAALAAELGAAYVRGLQGGDTLALDGVACVTKHFPGGGPQLGGEDPHFPYGREQVYPGGRFAEHLVPFEAAIAAGTSALMPYYGMPVGLTIEGEPVEEVGFGFNRGIVTDLLRDRLGYDGVVVTDWGLVTDSVVFGKPFPARAWGVEHLAPIDRVARILDAGCDQLGGESCTDLVLRLVEEGRVEEARIDRSARRLLLVKVRCGLFDDPYVDEDAAESIVGSARHREAGHRAQAEAMVVLANADVVPLAASTRVFLDGFGPDAAHPDLVVVAEPERADVALVRISAPFEHRDTYFLESATHQGSLDLPAATVEHIRALATRLPVVLVVHLDRPAILTPIIEDVAALLAEFGASDAAVLDALTGAVPAQGLLPVELPRSMAAVEASRPDVPSDTADPLFAVGAGG